MPGSFCLCVPVDRDEVEDAVSVAIEGSGDVSGAGAGVYDSNLDLAIDDDDVDVPGLLATIGELLRPWASPAPRFGSKGRRTGRRSRPADPQGRLDR